MGMESGRGMTPPYDKPRDAEGEFLKLLESLDEATRATAGVRRIENDVEDTEDFDGAIAKLLAFVAKRKSLEHAETVDIAESSKDINREGAMAMIADIRTAIKEKNPLGKGATSAVFPLRTGTQDRERMVCAKVVTDQQQYAAGASLREEMRFLEVLEDLRVEGARVPAPLFVFRSGEVKGIAMEHLEAASLDRVMDGAETEGVADALPAGFDADKYFASLRAFVQQMHKRGVIHNDLHPRNMMVHRTTGVPYLIDFGRANFAFQLDQNKTSLEKEAALDLASLDAAERKVRAWIVSKS